MRLRTNEFFENIYGKEEFGKMDDVRCYKLRHPVPSKVLNGTYFKNEFTEYITKNVCIRKVDDNLCISLTTSFVVRYSELLIYFIDAFSKPFSEAVGILVKHFNEDEETIKRINKLFDAFEEEYLTPLDPKEKNPFDKSAEPEKKMIVDIENVHSLDEACEICETIGYPCVFLCKDTFVQLNTAADFDGLMNFYSHRVINAKIIKGEGKNLLECLFERLDAN